MEKETEEKRKTKKNLRFVRAFSAGGVVFRKVKNKVFWLLVRLTGTDRWQLPKGTIDPGEKSLDAAIREVREEGGIEVRTLSKIGKIQYFFVLGEEKIFKTVTYYLMEFIKGTPGGHDHEVDEVRFFPFQEAFEKLSFDNDKNMLKKAKEILDSGETNNLL